MDNGNVQIVGLIQKVEDFFPHESNIFHFIKGTLVINCHTFRLYLTDKISIEHYLKSNSKFSHTATSNSREYVD